jgi:hypothetical protein
MAPLAGRTNRCLEVGSGPCLHAYHPRSLGAVEGCGQRNSIGTPTWPFASWPTRHQTAQRCSGPSGTGFCAGCSACSSPWCSDLAQRHCGRVNKYGSISFSSHPGFETSPALRGGASLVSSYISESNPSDIGVYLRLASLNDLPFGAAPFDGGCCPALSSSPRTPTRSRPRQEPSVLTASQCRTSCSWSRTTCSCCGFVEVGNPKSTSNKRREPMQAPPAGACSIGSEPARTEEGPRGRRGSRRRPRCLPIRATARRPRETLTRSSPGIMQSGSGRGAKSTWQAVPAWLARRTEAKV